VSGWRDFRFTTWDWAALLLEITALAVIFFLIVPGWDAFDAVQRFIGAAFVGVFALFFAFDVIHTVRRMSR
jgi:hypothetical protein